MGIKSIRTVDKVEQVVDNVNKKVQSLDGLFNLIDFTTDKIVSVSDKLVDGLSGILTRFILKKVSNKKKKSTTSDQK